MRELLQGVGDLGRGFRFWATTPRLMLLGAIPAVLVGAVWVGLLVALLSSLDPIAAALTGFAAGSPPPVRAALEVGVGVAVVVLAVVLGALTYTAVVLAVGDPFYERIGRAVEERLGDPPADTGGSALRGVLRAARDGIALLLLSLAVAAGSFLLGLIPVAGPVVGGAFGAVAGGWLLAVELTGTAFDARGLRQRDRRTALHRVRGRALGFGVATWVLFLVPFAAAVVMPAAVGGATALARAALAPAAPGRGTAAGWQGGGAGEPEEDR